jgi:hypothetical protein
MLNNRPNSVKLYLRVAVRMDPTARERVAVIIIHANTRRLSLVNPSAYDQYCTWALSQDIGIEAEGNEGVVNALPPTFL